MELEPVITQLVRWGARSPLRPRDAGMSIDAFVLALRTMFDPRAAGRLRASYELRLGEDRFRATVSDDRFEIVRGSAEEVETTITADIDTLAAMVFEGHELDEALRSGEVKIEGDKQAVGRNVVRAWLTFCGVVSRSTYSSTLATPRSLEPFVHVHLRSYTRMAVLPRANPDPWTRLPTSSGLILVQALS